MKIIDEVISKNPKLDKEETIEWYCPSEYGEKDIDNCCCGCDYCWNRPVKDE